MEAQINRAGDSGLTFRSVPKGGDQVQIAGDGGEIGTGSLLQHPETIAGCRQTARA